MIVKKYYDEDSTAYQYLFSNKYCKATVYKFNNDDLFVGNADCIDQYIYELSICANKHMFYTSSIRTTDSVYIVELIKTNKKHRNNGHAKKLLEEIRDYVYKNEDGFFLLYLSASVFPLLKEKYKKKDAELILDRKSVV